MRKVIPAIVFHLLTTSVVVLSQETNFFNTTTYAPNVSHHTNFCSRHRLAERGDMSLKDTLRGTKISVGLFRYQLVEDETGMYRIPELNPGAGIQFLDELATRGGFTWRESFGILDSPKQNETWDGLLRWSVDTYDLVGDWFLRTIDRLGDGVVFPEGWYDGSIIMVRKNSQDEYSYNIWAFALPFTSEVWWLIVGTTIASGLVYFLLDYIKYGGQKEKMELSLLENLYVSFIAFTGHLIHLPETAAPQILTFSVCFLFLLIMCAYTANLASFLVVRNAPTLVITDITDAIKNDLSFCVLKSSTSETTLRNDYKAARMVQKDSIGDTYLSVLAGECDIVLTTIGTWNRYEKNAKYNEGCSLEWVGRVVKPYDAGYSLRDSAERCSSLLRDALSLHMIDMKLERRDIAIWGKLINEKATINCAADTDSNVDDEEKNKLDVHNLGGIFVIHLAATTVAIVLAAVSWFRHSKGGHKRTKTQEGSTLPSSTRQSNPPEPSNVSPPQDTPYVRNDGQVVQRNQGDRASAFNFKPQGGLADDADDRQDVQCQGGRGSNPSMRQSCDFKPTMRQSVVIQNVVAFLAPEAFLFSQERYKKELMMVMVMVAAMVALWLSFFLLLYV